MAESLTFNVGADTSGFQTGIGGMLTGLAGLAAAFVSLQAVVESFSNAIEMGGRLHDLAQRTGETAGNLAILERAFENTSVGAEKVGPAIGKMQVAIAGLAEGSEKAVRAFQELGLSLFDVQNKSPLEQFEIIGRALAGIRDPAERAQIAVDIFGKTGQELIPILRSVGVELDLARDQLGSLPGILDKSSASFDAIGDSLNAIRQKSTELAVGFLSTLAPAIEKVLNALSTLDAANFGQGLSEFLLGAFSEPLKLIQLWGETMRYVSQLFINEMISGIDYISRLLGLSLTESLGAVFGGLAKYIEPIFTVAKLLNPAIASLQFGVNDVMKTVAEVKEKIGDAFTKAVNDTSFIRKDYTDAASSAERIAGLTSDIREDGRAFAEYLAGATLPTMLTTPFGQSGTELLDAIVESDKRLQESYKLRSTPMGGTGTELLDAVIAEDKRNANAGGGASVQTAAQFQAEQNRRLGLVAGANTTQAIGQSASARRAMELQQEIDLLNATGKNRTQAEQDRIAHLQHSLQTNQDIAFGNALTPSDKETARQWALDQWMGDTSQSFSELQADAEKNILEQKRGDSALSQDAQSQKAKEAAQTRAEAQGKTVQSLAQSVLSILQKIEPKLPQHIMS